MEYGSGIHRTRFIRNGVNCFCCLTRHYLLITAYYPLTPRLWPLAFFPIDPDPDSDTDFETMDTSIQRVNSDR